MCRIMVMYCVTVQDYDVVYGCVQDYGDVL